MNYQLLSNYTQLELLQIHNDAVAKGNKELSRLTLNAIRFKIYKKEVKKDYLIA